jgi:hypothetical protein
VPAAWIAGLMVEFVTIPRNRREGWPARLRAAAIAAVALEASTGVAAVSGGSSTGSGWKRFEPLERCLEL